MTTRRKNLVGAALALALVAGIVLVTQLTAISYTSVRDALIAHGASVQEDGLGTQPVLGGTDHRLTVNGGGVDVFEYRTTLGASLDASGISFDGSTISRGFGPFSSTAVIDYHTPPHWFHAGRVLVRYVGSRDSILALLRAVLGAQFAGSSQDGGRQDMWLVTALVILAARARLRRANIRWRGLVPSQRLRSSPTASVTADGHTS